MGGARWYQSNVYWCPTRGWFWIVIYFVDSFHLSCSGALPFQVEQININFNKLPKRINMKRVNAASLVSVQKQFERSIELPVNVRADEEFEQGYATFANTHGSLVKRFKDIASPSITLFSLLHNTNDHRFKLDRKSNETTNNFKIQQLKKHRSRPSFDSNEHIVDVERNTCK